MNTNLLKSRGLKQEALRLISTVGLLALRRNKGRTKDFSKEAATRFPPQPILPLHNIVSNFSLKRMASVGYFTGYFIHSFDNSDEGGSFPG